MINFIEYRGDSTLPLVACPEINGKTAAGTGRLACRTGT